MSLPFPRRYHQPHAAIHASGGNDILTRVLLHMDGAHGGTTFTESAIGTAGHTWTAVGTAVTSTAASQFGGAALDCGAAAGYVEAADSADFTLGSGDWTADCWFNRQGGNGTRRMLFGQSNAAASAISIYAEINAANVIHGFADAGAINVTGTTAFTATGWNHVALVRSGAALKLFVNGVQEGGDQAIAGSVTDISGKLAVGRLGEFGLNWNGYLDEFRLSVGIARWTANFTPPTAAYS